MRIDNTTKAGGGSGPRRAQGASAGALFEVGAQAPAARSVATYSAASATPLDALLALQSVDTATEGRKRKLRRGRTLLDTLDLLKSDLLMGRLGEGHLNQLMALVGQASERTEPGLDAMLDEIELRVRVELAKRGCYPA